MTAEILAFFAGRREELGLYEALEERILSEIGDVTVKVSKTQLSFYNRRMFACVSFARVGSKAQRPPVCLTVTFGLNRREEHPRVAVAVQPYPGRWTHHLLLARREEIDGQLMGWLAEAAAFSAAKR